MQIKIQPDLVSTKIVPCIIAIIVPHIEVVRHIIIIKTRYGSREKLNAIIVTSLDTKLKTVLIGVTRVIAVEQKLLDLSLIYTKK
eukprot:UN32007